MVAAQKASEQRMGLEQAQRLAARANRELGLDVGCEGELGTVVLPLGEDGFAVGYWYSVWYGVEEYEEWLACGSAELEADEEEVPF